MKPPKIKLTGFGRMVIGAKRVAEERAYVKEGRTKFGPLVLGDRVKPGTNTPIGNTITADASLEVIGDVLGKNPAFLSSYVEREFAREPQLIRRGAMRLFIDTAPKAYPDNADKVALIVNRCEAFLAKGIDIEKGEVRKQGISKATLVEGAAPEKALGKSADEAHVRATEAAVELARIKEQGG